jgi:hypothetical protein
MTRVAFVFSTQRWAIGQMRHLAVFAEVIGILAALR